MIDDDDPEMNANIMAVGNGRYTREIAERKAAEAQRARTPGKPMINPQCGSQGLDRDGHCGRCGLIPIMGDHCPPGFLDATAEMIIRAAIQHEGTVYSLPAPARHHNVIALMIGDGLPDESCRLQNQGFVTSTGRFVDRYEGFRVARAAGQLWRSPTPPDMLTSEDVW